MQIDEKKIEALLLEGLPGAEILVNRIEADKPEDDIYSCHMTMPHKHKSRFDFPILEAHFVFDPSKHKVDIYKVDVAPDKLQGQGICKKLLTNIARTSELLDTPRMMITATDVGGYTWARLGFVVANYDAEFKTAVLNSIVRVDAPPSVKKGFRQAIESGDPKSIWSIADSEYGCKALKGVSYNAMLNLNDPEAKHRFQKHTFLSKEQGQKLAALLTEERERER